ncbi:MAG TPA: excinuclease ABC subunit UvrA [Polyangiaceae bacterium]|nr:excinuclease ABC subunit UvrA [Polyangiaceae bacterium]
MLHTRLESARTHNLKDVSLELEPGTLVVLSGVSGAGKSSLAIDTLYAEGQRRFVESFSPYARQFLERLERPPMQSLEPVPAAVAVDRRAPVKSSRSTLATLADLEPYFSALFLREAVPVCPEHQVEGTRLDPERAAARVGAELGVGRALVTYPLGVDRVESYLGVRDNLAQQGYRRLWVSGELLDIERAKPSQVLAAGSEVGVVVDRVTTTERTRVAQAVEQAWQRGAGVCVVRSERESFVLRQGLGCGVCGRELPEPSAGLFSYESPVGACATCRGFGRTLGIDLDKVIPDKTLSLKAGAIRAFRGKSTSYERGELAKLCRRHGIPFDRPYAELGAAQQRLVLEGDGSFEDGLFPGVLGWFRWLETRTYKMHVRVFLSRYRAYDLCHGCGGRRLNATALAFRVDGLDLAQWHALEVGAALEKLAQLETRSAQGELARKELVSRLDYLKRVGLGYLTLDRQARTLSGGEAQRVTLTAALGTSLNNALFVLDEPTIGLHPSDIEPLITLLHELAARNNCVLVVEHDPAVMAAAGRVIELGPGAGSEGGRIVGDGVPSALGRGTGVTAQTLIGLPPRQRPPRAWAHELRVVGATEHNLKLPEVRIPLGVICAVTGPSGSGKSSLVVDTVYRALALRAGELDVEAPGHHERLEGAERVTRVTLVDQTPLGRTSRGNAATYTKAWDCIRTLYAREPSAARLGLQAKDFSFNVEGGRCEACAGEGYETVEMQFLSDVRLICPTCQGRRFKPHVLSVERHGVSIADVLNMTVTDALHAFRAEASVQRALGPLARLGLGYLRLGQPLSTLSGGEAQRLKLCRALAELRPGELLVLDEPSAGLHVSEVEKLLGVLDTWVDSGGSVLMVEHDLDVIANADYVIDLGPGGGRRGGELVACGSVDELIERGSRTGEALARRLKRTGRTHGGARASSRKPTPSVRSEAVLRVEQAREHNLKNVSIGLPHGAFSVVTGPSGSGKSTLAFDVVFAEGQRRFLETLTPYARQFLPSMPRPDVDRVSGVPPAIALPQRTARAGGLSTVATVTEVAHYLRLLYAKLGTPHCPEHQTPIARRSFDELRADVHAQRKKSYLLAPVVQQRKGTYLDVFSSAARAGILQAFVDGALVSTQEPPKLARSREHTIDLLIASPASPKTFEPATLRRALDFGRGSLKLRTELGDELLFSSEAACPICGFSPPELDPRWFSFATKQGRCEACEGNGVLETERTVGRGKTRRVEVVRQVCAACRGQRLNPIVRSVRLDTESYPEFTARSVRAALERARRLRFDARLQPVAAPLIGELTRRLQFLCDVGLDYLALDRHAATLSGGEMQRLRLAAQLGAGLTGALYVLDEPTIGLHPRDTDRLIRNLKQLVELGSTVLVVEHDLEIMRAADYLIDMGPSGGAGGGRVVAAGSPSQVLALPDSATARVLANPPYIRKALPVKSTDARLLLSGATQHNLKGVDLNLVLGRFNVVCGVSGSGKSTLVSHVLLPALRRALGLVAEEPGAHAGLTGFDALQRALSVDQSPIGRTPRSVPATFLGIWDEIRRLFAATPEAQVAGFNATRFSFNSKQGGACTTCDGQGSITHEMSFLPDVVAPCPTCEGLRFEPRTLAVRYLGLNVGEVLKLTAEQACERFEHHPRLKAPLRTLTELGAGYIQLGQGSHTLSGGEAQRLKLALELTAGARHERTLYVLDEPTTGLHPSDVERLLSVLGRLVERGDTLVVIEHHPQVIASADWIVELGPEGGENGGKIVAEGTAREVARRKSATASVIQRILSL